MKKMSFRNEDKTVSRSYKQRNKQNNKKPPKEQKIQNTQKQHTDADVLTHMLKNNRQEFNFPF